MHYLAEEMKIGMVDKNDLFPSRSKQNGILLLSKQTGNSKYFEATEQGISVGKHEKNNFVVSNDQMVSDEHGTFDLTCRFGIWVYVDHSSLGTLINGKNRIHHSAAVLNDGDYVTLGSTDIIITIYSQNFSEQESDHEVSIMENMNLKSEKKLLKSKNIIINNDNNFHPDFINSPLTKASRHTFPNKNGNTSSNSNNTWVEKDSTLPPPPLEYSSSPLSTHNLIRKHLHEGDIKQDNCIKITHGENKVPKASPVPSRSDTLRIQVSKKMAADAHTGSINPSKLKISKNLFNLQKRKAKKPFSPVPHQVILHQNQTFFKSVKSKQEEDERLRAEQEEWLKIRQPQTNNKNRFENEAHDRIRESGLNYESYDITPTGRKEGIAFSSTEFEKAQNFSIIRNYSLGSYSPESTTSSPGRIDICSSVSSSVATEIASYHGQGYSPVYYKQENDIDSPIEKLKYSLDLRKADTANGLYSPTSSKNILSPRVRSLASNSKLHQRKRSFRNKRRS